LEPYREEAHRALMESLARSGQRSAALAQYERCCGVLADELAVEPSLETQQLYQRIRSAGQTRPNNLPVGGQSFVGRQVERQEIGHRLADPECRLITLVGMGGIGKTSLALQIAREHQDEFWEGVFWVPLTAVQQPEQIINALFDALSLTPGNDPRSQLLDYLRDKTILLVFDNFEQLLSICGQSPSQALQLLDDILKHSQYAKILVTSRQKLSLRSEWLYPLEGLPYSFDRESDPDALLEQAAIQLFIRRARQLLPGFPRQESDYQPIARICQLVCGIPLGIELASGWVDQISCQEIAERIASDLDFLVSSLHDQLDRHHSLRAVFQHSWQLLAPEQQAVLRQLSVIQGSFGRSASQEIAQGKPHQLNELVNKSWLQQDVKAEYSLHPVLKQFLAEALASEPVEEHEIRRRHAHYFARFLKERENALTVQYQAAALDEVGTKISDVLSAWEWAVRQRVPEMINGLLEGVFIYYWAHNQFAAGLARLEQAITVIDELESSPQQALLLARLGVRIADFKYWLGNLEMAERLLNSNIDSLDHQEQAYALELASRVYYWQGVFDKSQAAARASIEIARRHGPLHVLAQALNSLANTVCEASGDYDCAQELYNESLAIYRQIDNPFGIAKALINKGAIYFERGELAHAQQLYLESLQHYRTLNYDYGISACLNNLAMIARKDGDWETARALIEESLALKRQTGNQVAIVHALLEIGALETDMGHFVKARQSYTEALQIAQETQASGLIFNIVLAFAELFRQMEEPIQAARLAFWVSAQQEVGQELLAQTEAVVASLQERLSPAEIEGCRQQSQYQDLGDLNSILAAA
ncbi:MAG: tetratricopeptide repeat protein, partial [Anaerolineales bacterium]|nr:tetratricopeptide repeat protein [Anaerolineales bacterium]